MEQYFKIVEEGYISLVGTGSSDNAITREEYETILSVIHNRPTADPGYTYKLRTDLTWELCEAPPIPEEDEEATEEDYLAALAELGVCVNV
jgi:hypothetical protein